MQDTQAPFDFEDVCSSLVALGDQLARSIPVAASVANSVPATAAVWQRNGEIDHTTSAQAITDGLSWSRANEHLSQERILVNSELTLCLTPHPQGFWRLSTYYRGKLWTFQREPSHEQAMQAFQYLVVLDERHPAIVASAAYRRWLKRFEDEPMHVTLLQQACMDRSYLIQCVQSKAIDTGHSCE